MIYNMDSESNPSISCEHPHFSIKIVSSKEDKEGSFTRSKRPHQQSTQPQQIHRILSSPNTNVSKNRSPRPPNPLNNPPHPLNRSTLTQRIYPNPLERIHTRPSRKPNPQSSSRPQPHKTRHVHPPKHERHLRQKHPPKSLDMLQHEYRFQRGVRTHWCRYEL